MQPISKMWSEYKKYDQLRRIWLEYKKYVWYTKIQNS